MRHDRLHELVLGDLAVAVGVHFPEGAICQGLLVHAVGVAEQMVDILDDLLDLLPSDEAVTVNVKAVDEGSMYVRILQTSISNSCKGCLQHTFVYISCSLQ